MSIEIMNAVWRESRSEGRARLVLLTIADHQGEMGAWPSIERLAQMVNASVRTIQREIQILEALGELRVERRNAPTGGQYKANLYWVTLPSVMSEVTAEVTNALPEVTNATLRGDSSWHVNQEPLIETNNRSAQFDEFWKEYPLKKDKGKAIKAFKAALTHASFEQILAGAIAYRHDSQRKPEFTKYPTTWLNAFAWENEIAPSPDSEAAERATQRRDRELQRSNDYLAEIREQEKHASAPKLCEHGKNLALCLPCSKSLG